MAECLDELGLAAQVAERLGDFPSPTVLVDGVDVMTGAVGASSTQACRLDLPTRSRVLAALGRHGSSGSEPVVSVESDWYPPALSVGVVRDRIGELSPAARTLHRTILRSFAATGRAPDRDALAVATGGGNVADLLGELHVHDVIRLDDAGRVRAAYPFSGVPTAHAVAIEGGPSVYAMCAIDALGMAEMLGRDIVITSTDPLSGADVRVTVDGGRLAWQPETAVVFVGGNSPADPDCCDPVTRPAAADRCCGVMNFFTDADSAQAWIGQHPAVSGVVLSQRQAWRMGVDIFAHVLHD